ncbi:MAG: protein-glutamate O-methyltransferase CheR [Pseudomonadota bacterium]
MKLKLTAEEFLLFRGFIEKQCGIFLGNDKSYLVEHRLSKLVAENCCSSYGDLFRLARKEAFCGKLCGRIIDAITTNETSWFRDPKQFEVLRYSLLPRLWARSGGGRGNNVEIWSAACSTGQEPYTIALTCLDFCQTVVKEPNCHKRFRILATDISESALTSAKSGVYDQASLNRGLETSRWGRFFRKSGSTWSVGDELREMVTFKHFNLQSPFVGLGTFDIVFLRNVIIYFSDAMKKEVFRRTADCLAPGGKLFLGTGETASGHSDKFEVEEDGGTIFYRRK